MAYTTPRTWVAGEVTTAANLNTHVRDNIAWMATDSPACRAFNNANISHTASGSMQAVTMNSERFDNASVHSTSVATSRFTIPTGGGGKYIIGGLLSFANNATGNRGGRMRVNGTTDVAGQITAASTGGTDTSDFTITTTYALAAADYVELMGFQSSGGALNMLVQANFSPEAWVTWYRT